MTTPTAHQLSLADGLYQKLLETRRSERPVIIVVVDEHEVLKNVIEEKEAVAVALATLHLSQPAETNQP